MCVADSLMSVDNICVSAAVCWTGRRRSDSGDKVEQSIKTEGVKLNCKVVDH